MTEYVHVNTNHIQAQIKRALKDEYSGKMSREECAIILRSLAEKMEAKRTNQPAFNFSELQEHLKGNQRG